MLLSIIMVVGGIVLINWNKRIAQKINTSPPLFYKVLKIRSRLYSGDPHILLFGRFVLIAMGILSIIFAYFNYFGPLE